MTRKYGVYLKEGLKSSKATMKRKGARIKYILFNLMKVGALIFPFMVPIVSMAEVRLSKNAIKYNEIDIIGSFKVGCRAKVFWNTVIAYLISFLIILAGVIGIGIIAGLFILLGYALSVLGKTDIMFMLVAFSLPGIIMILAFVVFASFYFAPIAYIGDTVEDIDGASIVKKSFNAMRKGKLIVFLNSLFIGLILSIVVALPTAIIIFCSSNPILLIVSVFVTLGFLVAVYFVLPPFLLGFNNANVLFFEDVVLDSITERKSVRGIVIAKNKKNNKNKLAELFDRTEERHFTKNNKIEGLDMSSNDKADEVEDSSIEEEEMSFEEAEEAILKEMNGLDDEIDESSIETEDEEVM